MTGLKIVLWTLAAPLAIAFGPLRAFRLYRPSKREERRATPGEIEEIVRDADRILMFRVFNRLLFRTRCLKRSLVLFRLLRLRGYDARAYIGFQQKGSELFGHAWLKVREIPVPEAHPHDHRCIAFYEIGDEVRMLSGA